MERDPLVFVGASKAVPIFDCLCFVFVEFGHCFAFELAGVVCFDAPILQIRLGGTSEKSIFWKKIRKNVEVPFLRGFMQIVSVSTMSITSGEHAETS